MAHMAEACEECTQNCRLMHKKKKNASPVVTDFFKIMFGDDISKIMFLPPRFARTVRNKVGKATQLEDYNGEKWDVKFTKVDGHIAFKEGWNAFWKAHGLKQGDCVFFFYIMESHFVVKMHGQSGCPELRHYGQDRDSIKKNREHRKITVDDRGPSKVKSNGCDRLCDPASESDVSLYGDSEKKEKNTKEKRKDIASSSQHGHSGPGLETGQGSDPLTENTDPENTVSETPVMKKNCLVDSDTGNLDDESGKNGLCEFSNPEIDLKESGGRKNNVGSSSGGGGENRVKETEKVLETRSEESKEMLKEKSKEMLKEKSREKLKEKSREKSKEMLKEKSRETLKEKPREKSKEKLEESSVRPNEATCNNKRMSTDVPIAVSKKPKITPSETRPKMTKIEPVSASKPDTPDPRIPASNGILSKGKSMRAIKEEPTTNHGSNGKPMEAIKKEPTMRNDGSNGRFSDIKMGFNSFMGKDNEILQKVKPEPVDYDEAPPSGPTIASFSAVMSSYEYLELPEWVKIKSKVIFLKNRNDLWPVLYQQMADIKALTQSWGVFAKVSGIKVGDKCDFVLEKEAHNNYTCSVYRVNVNRK